MIDVLLVSILSALLQYYFVGTPLDRLTIGDFLGGVIFWFSTFLYGLPFAGRVVRERTLLFKFLLGMAMAFGYPIFIVNIGWVWLRLYRVLNWRLADSWLLMFDFAGFATVFVLFSVMLIVVMRWVGRRL